MAGARTEPSVGRSTWLGWLWSGLVLGIGLWVSPTTGEWIALVCAAGLVILPLGGRALRSRRR
ncbi:hypothetical protein [Cryobacterium sp.]|jgi:hypothetical protein|uniref:hypothetical protein n=1 Tax=Cryobacterium sp. TaxID=1926290 RepID=UPI00260B4151|nr:hypothetical protein [Cryobacterium sp.]MCU1445519.1 hypothetical protein [Cryobacterium sp.]